MATPQKGRIFISYRRVDTSYAAGRIYDRLFAHFGADAIFMDVDTIEGGVDFVNVLEDAVQSCDVLIALIGRQWLTIKDKGGNRRIDNPEDFVRIEIATALNRNIRVIPVLVDGIAMPRAAELPENLKPLAQRNALQVNHQSFNTDVYRLIKHIESALNEKVRTKRRLNSKNRIMLVVLIALALVLLSVFGLPPLLSQPENTLTPTLPITKEVTQESPTPTATFVPTPTPSLTEITDNFGVEMMLVPAGEFTMGVDVNEALAKEECQSQEDGYYCRPEAYEPSSPEHQVYLDAFYMDKYEVTNSLYKDCVDVGICDPPKQTSSNSHQSYYGNPQFDNNPVIFVDWNMANTYCEIWRAGYLPSEEQWEKAARGGLDGKKYPWGDQEPICVEGAENGARFQYLPGNNGCVEKDTEVVGSYSPNGYGLYDMSGNVAEWVNAWYDAYPGSSFSSPHFGTTHRVERDGGWNRHFLGVWGRGFHSPSGYYYSLGFRCAKDATP